MNSIKLNKILLVFYFTQLIRAGDQEPKEKSENPKILIEAHLLKCEVFPCIHTLTTEDGKLSISFCKGETIATPCQSNNPVSLPLSIEIMPEETSTGESKAIPKD